jgi:hypothetical protein
MLRSEAAAAAEGKPTDFLHGPFCVQHLLIPVLCAALQLFILLHYIYRESIQRVAYQPSALTLSFAERVLRNELACSTAHIFSEQFNVRTACLLRLGGTAAGLLKLGHSNPARPSRAIS